MRRPLFVLGVVAASLSCAVAQDFAAMQDSVLPQDSTIAQDSTISQDSAISQDSTVMQDPVIDQDSAIAPDSAISQDSAVVPDPMTDATVSQGSPLNAPGKECEAYYHAETANAVGSFPPIWEAATILPGDTNAAAKWAAIQPSVPDIAPKGTPAGDFTAMNYSSDDPDCWWTNTKCNTPKQPNMASDISIMDEPSTLGYGFDDGPNCSHNAFYDFLKSQNQKATMFFIGSNVMDWPLETARAVTDGHEVCVHGWSHKYMTSFESADAFAELYYTTYDFNQMQAIKLAAGVTPTCWRPPFGDVDDRIRAIANGLGLRTVLWAYDSQDWQVGSTAGYTPEMVDKEYENMIADAKKGAFANTGTMILAHELNEFTMNQAMKYYPKLKEVFKNIVPVATGMNITHPYVEDGYTMENFVQYVASRGGEKLIKNGTNTTSSGLMTQTAPPSVATDQLSANPTTTKKSGAAPRMTPTGLATAVVLGFVGAALAGLVA